MDTAHKTKIVEAGGDPNRLNEPASGGPVYGGDPWRPRSGQIRASGLPPVSVPHIECGYYTVVFDESRDDRVTLRVRPHWDEGAARRGERVIDYLYGSENTRDYKGFAFITASGDVRIWRAHSHAKRLQDAVDVLRSNPEDAGLAYALRSGNCYRCGRTLTVPASIHRGLGPVCARL